MVAPRALVFRPLVKGSEALGTRLVALRIDLANINLCAHASSTCIIFPSPVPSFLYSSSCCNFFPPEVFLRKESPYILCKNMIFRFWHGLLLNLVWFSEGNYIFLDEDWKRKKASIETTCMKIIVTPIIYWSPVTTDSMNSKKWKPEKREKSIVRNQEMGSSLNTFSTRVSAQFPQQFIL